MDQEEYSKACRALAIWHPFCIVHLTWVTAQILQIDFLRCWIITGSTSQISRSRPGVILRDANNLGDPCGKMQTFFDPQKVSYARGSEVQPGSIDYQSHCFRFYNRLPKSSSYTRGAAWIIEYLGFSPEVQSVQGLSSWDHGCKNI